MQILHLIQADGFNIVVVQDGINFIGTVFFHGGRKMDCKKDSASGALVECYAIATTNLTSADLDKC